MNIKRKGLHFLMGLWILAMLIAISGCEPESTDVVSNDQRVGVMLIGVGEPENMEAGVEAWQSFLKNYMAGGMGLIPGIHLDKLAPMMGEMSDLLKGSTLLLDIDHPFSFTPHRNPNLIDAWGNPYLGKNYVFIPMLPQGLYDMMFKIPMMGSMIEMIVDMVGDVPSFYCVPGLEPKKRNPGKGAPDIWEYINLTMYPLYAGLNNDNPTPFNEIKMFENVKQKIEDDFGDEVVLVKFGYGAAHEGFPHFLDVAQNMVESYNLDKLIVAESYVVHSRFESPGHHTKKILERRGYDVEVICTEQVGGSKPFSIGVAEVVEEELTGTVPDFPDSLSGIPVNEKTAVFLVHHGFFATDYKVFDMDWEPYNDNAQIAYNAAKTEIIKVFRNLGWDDENFAIIKIYPEMSTGILDPFHEHFSVEEAMEAIVRPMGFKHLINVPYEVGMSAYENLWHFRHPWHMEAGDSDPDTIRYTDNTIFGGGKGIVKFRSEFTDDKDLHIVITDGWIPNWDDAMYERIYTELDNVIPMP